MCIRDRAYTILVAAACPTATSINMMAIKYGQDYRYCSEMFAFTTVLSMLTVPVMVFFGEMIL